MSLPNYCADWRGYEEGVSLVYKLQNKLSDKDAVLTLLRRRFSPLAEFVSSDEAITTFKLTGGQTTLAKSYVKGEALERAVADATDGGEKQQTALASHKEAHKTLQANIIKEALEMQRSDPFWKARATAVVAAAAHYPEAKIRAHLHPELFKAWLNATDGDSDEEEVKGTIKEHVQRFMDDPLSPSEQLVAWSNVTGGLQDKGHSTDSTAAAAAAAAGSGIAPAAAMEATPWVDASGKLVVDALKVRLGPFLGKPEVFCYQCTANYGTQVLAKAFMEALQTGGFDARVPGVTSWAAQNELAMIAIPIAANFTTNAAILERVFNSFCQQQFQQASDGLKEWLTDCTSCGLSEENDIFATLRGDMGFVMLKVQLETFAKQCNDPLIPAAFSENQTLLEQLTSKSPAVFLELAGLATVGVLEQSAMQGAVSLMKSAMLTANVNAMTANSAPQMAHLPEEAREQMKAQMEQQIKAQLEPQFAAVPDEQFLQQIQLQNQQQAQQMAASVQAMFANVLQIVSAFDYTESGGIDAAVAAAADGVFSSPGNEGNSFNEFTKYGDFMTFIYKLQVENEARVTAVVDYFQRIDPEVASHISKDKMAFARCECCVGLFQKVSALGAPESLKLSAKKISVKIGEISKLIKGAKPSLVLPAAAAKHGSDFAFLVLQDFLRECLEQVISSGAQLFAKSESFAVCASMMRSKKGKDELLSFELSYKARNELSSKLEHLPAGKAMKASVASEKASATMLVEAIAMEFKPFYQRQLLLAGGQKVRKQNDPFLSLKEGIFSPLSIEYRDMEKLAIFGQFLTFRVQTREDPTRIPQLLAMTKGVRPLKKMTGLIEKNSEAFVNGPMLPEESEFGYSNARLARLAILQEAAVKLRDATDDLLGSKYGNDLQFLQLKLALEQQPTPEAFTSALQQLMNHPQYQGMAQDIAQNHGQMQHHKLTGLEKALVAANEDVTMVQQLLRRRWMDDAGPGPPITSIPELDGVRAAAANTGGGIASLELLMLLYDLSFKAEEISNQPTTPTIEEHVLFNRLQLRDAKLAAAVQAHAPRMLTKRVSLLKSSEQMWLRHCITTAVLRFHFPPEERALYRVVDASSPLTEAQEKASYLHAIDLASFALPSINKLCLDHLEYLDKVASEIHVRDAPRSAEGARTQDKSPYLKFYRSQGVELSRFLLWKLEHFAAHTAYEVDIVMKREENDLYMLKDDHPTQFRTDPFTTDQIGILQRIISRAKAGLLSSSHASPFEDAVEDPDFAATKVWAQQLCDHESSLDPKEVILKRFRSRPALAKHLSVLETHLEAFVREPLSPSAQAIGWPLYLKERNSKPKDGQGGARAGMPPLARAMHERNQARVKEMLNANPPRGIFAAYDFEGNSLMRDALQTGQVEMVDLLLAYSKKREPGEWKYINEPAGSKPLLHIVLIWWGSKEIDRQTEACLIEGLDLLTKRGMDLREIWVDADGNRFSPLFLAVTNSNYAAVRWLAKHLAEKEITDSVEMNVMHAVAQMGSDFEMVRVIVELGGSVDALGLPISQDGGAGHNHTPYSALITALISTHPDMALELINFGANPNTYIYYPNPERIKTLMKKTEVPSDNVAFEESVKFVRTDCLSLATNFPDVVKAMLAKGADATYQDQVSGIGALHVACRDSTSAIPVIDMLLAAGADLQCRNHQGHTPLSLACQSQRPQVVEHLVKTCGAAVNVANNVHEAPIHLCAYFGDLKSLGILMEHGADLHATDARGNSVLHFAAIGNKVDAADFLIAAGANERARDKKGVSVFTLAAMANAIELAKKLVARHRDVLEDRTNEGETVLHVICKNAKPDDKCKLPTALWIISMEVDVTVRDKNQMTALHHACCSGNIDLVQALLWSALHRQAYASESMAKDTSGVASSSLWGLTDHPTRRDSYRHKNNEGDDEGRSSLWGLTDQAEREGVYAVNTSSSEHESRNNDQLHQGWLLKKGGWNTAWKKRFFVLVGVELRYFESEAVAANPAKQKGAINLSTVSGTTFDPSERKLDLVSKDRKGGKWELKALDDASFDSWRESLLHAVAQHGLIAGKGDAMNRQLSRRWGGNGKKRVPTDGEEEKELDGGLDGNALREEAAPNADDDAPLDESGVNSFASVCGLATDGTLNIEELTGRSGDGNLIVTPLFFAAHNRHLAIVEMLLKGVPRPCDAHPMQKMRVPSANGICNASGLEIPYPGFYYGATDGCDFGIRCDVYDAAVRARELAKKDAPTGSSAAEVDLRWKQATTIMLRFIEPIELTEVLCCSVQSVDLRLTKLAVARGARLNAPDLVGQKRPVQYADSDSAVVELTEKNFKAAVLDSQIPVVVQPYAEWSASCKELEPLLEGVVRASNSKLLFARLNVDKHATLKSQLTVKALPSVLGFFRGQIVARLAGVTPSPEELDKFFNELLSAPTTPGNEGASATPANDAGGDAQKRIRQFLLTAGAQVFISGAGRGRNVRGSIAGHSALHRMVWYGKEVQQLSSGQQGFVDSKDDILSRTPAHHAAKRGNVGWLRVLREYGGAHILDAVDVEGFGLLHDLAISPSAKSHETLKLLISWAKARAFPGGKSAHLVVNRETFNGETALELAMRGRREVYNTTPSGIFFRDLWKLSIACIFVGIVVGGVAGKKWWLATLLGIPSLPAGVLVCTLAGWAVFFCRYLFLCCSYSLSEPSGYDVGANLSRRSSTKTMSEAIASLQSAEINGVSEETPASTAQQEQLRCFCQTPGEAAMLMKRYDAVIDELIQAGATNVWRRFFTVKLWRIISFVAFGIWTSVFLPFCLLRDIFNGTALSDMLIMINPPCGTHRGNERCSCCAWVMYLILVIAPLAVAYTDSTSTAKLLAACYILVLMLFVFAIFRRALGEKRLWCGSNKPHTGQIRFNIANLCVIGALLIEWNQLCAVAFTPDIRWPISMPLGNYFAAYTLDLETLGFTPASDDVAAPESALMKFRSSDGFSFLVNVLFCAVWVGVIGFLATSCAVRASPRLRARFPFVRSDFFGQLPGADVLVPIMTNGLFMSILSNMLTTFDCAFDSGSSAACFRGGHKLQAVVAMYGLLFYLPSAFVVGISFLNDEKNDLLDIRFLLGYEVIVNTTKTLLGLVALLFEDRPALLLGCTLGCLLALSVATWKILPCRELRSVTMLRFAFQLSALCTAVCALVSYVVGDEDSNLAAILFVAGNATVLAGAAICYLKAPSLFEATGARKGRGDDGGEASDDGDVEMAGTVALAAGAYNATSTCRFTGEQLIHHGQRRPSSFALVAGNSAESLLKAGAGILAGAAVGVLEMQETAKEQAAARLQEQIWEFLGQQGQ